MLRREKDGKELKRKVDANNLGEKEQIKKQNQRGKNNFNFFESVNVEKISFALKNPSRSLKRKLWTAMLLNVSVVICIVFSACYVNKKTTYDQTIEIKKGESIKKSLEGLNLNNNLLFKAYLKLKDEGRGIKAGYYNFNGEYSIREIVNILEEGQDKILPFTIQEGLTIKEITIKLQNERGLDPNKIKEALAEVDFPYPTPNGNFEGYFYPETYFIPEHASEKYIVNVFLNEFLKRYPSEKYPDKEKFYKNLVLASIIEREAVIKSEKPLISSVFHNRMKRGMYLASDATVNYLYDYTKRKMYYKDLEIKSPYNTYKNKGLPPGPIGNPDEKSIEAAMNPVKSKYYFFVASGGGAHHFSKTYQEHLRFQENN